MGYRISYLPDSRERKRKIHKLLRKTFVWFLACSLLIPAFRTFCPEGWNLFLRVILPGEPQATMEAAECFLADLRGGTSLSDAARTFCLTVMESGYIP